jgi:hypothetical protein
MPLATDAVMELAIGPPSATLKAISSPLEVQVMVKLGKACPENQDKFPPPVALTPNVAGGAFTDSVTAIVTVAGLYPVAVVAKVTLPE